MTDEDSNLDYRGSTAAAARAIEGPPGLGAWLGQTQSDAGHSRLEWQESCGSRGAAEYQLREAIPSKKIYNAAVEEDVRSQESEPFSIHRLRTAAKYFDTRNFDAFVPHEILLDASLAESHATADQAIFPGSSLCAELGVLPLGPNANTHFYVIGTVTGRRANKFSVLLPQDTLYLSRGWTAAPIPEKDDVIVTHPTPILDVKIRTNATGNIFGLRSSSTLTVLAFTRLDKIRGSGDIAQFTWKEPLHLGTECFAGSTVADLALNPFMAHKRNHLAIIVDSTGGLWRTRFGAEATSKLPFTSPYAAVEQLRLGCGVDGRSSFARITYGKDENSAVIAREDAVRVFNLEDHLEDITLFSLSNKKTRILDMAQPTRSYPYTAHRIICTTKEIIWLDLDKPGAPVMRHQHYRDDDKTLSLHSEFCNGVYHTFLWSRKTPVMTVFTTPAIGPLQLVLPPYTLPPPIPNLRRSGINSIHIPSKQLKRTDQILPESLILVESAADGAVYQRELIIESVPTMAHGYEHGRLEHKRLDADQHLLHLPLRDPKAFKLAHLFMLYNRFYSSQPSLHKSIDGPDSLEICAIDTDGAVMRIPLETIVTKRRRELQETANTDNASRFTSNQAIDSSAVSAKALLYEIDRLSKYSHDVTLYTITNQLLGIPDEIAPDALSLSKYLQETYSCNRFRTVDGRNNRLPEYSTVGAAHQTACEQIAVDLSLSRDVSSADTPQPPAVGVQDQAMSTYDRLADLPELEYGFFKPVKADGSIPTSDAARALLSEWTLGADPLVRPPFSNPYSQQVKDEKIANKQLKAFKTRIAQGVDVSASQPLSAFRRPQPANTQLPPPPTAAPPVSRTEIELTPRQGRSAIAQSQKLASSQQETPMPFTQMMPGAHGGRPAKKKKRMGGF